MNKNNSFDAASYAPITNNVMCEEYRRLSEEEKQAMHVVKNAGQNFHQLLDSLGSSREISVAKTKVEEAVMWAVKHITK